MGFRKCFEQACEAPCRLTHGRASVSLGISRHASRKQINWQRNKSIPIQPHPHPQWAQIMAHLVETYGCHVAQ